MVEAKIEWSEVTKSRMARHPIEGLSAWDGIELGANSTARGRTKHVYDHEAYDNSLQARRHSVVARMLLLLFMDL